jgi:hypothetical protein
MKSCKVALFLALFAAVCLPAVAQNEMRLNIPFDFVASGKSLPAGHYKVAPVWLAGQSVWHIYNAQASVQVLTKVAESAQAAHPLSLVFSQSGAGYSLVQIWPTEHSGRELLRPRAQQTLVAEGGTYVEIGAE